MECHIVAVVQLLDFVAHVFVELLGVHLQSSLRENDERVCGRTASFLIAYLEQAKKVLHTSGRYRTLSARVDDIPNGLEMSNVRVAEQCVLLVRIEQREVLHDDSDEKIKDDVGNDDVERAEVKNRCCRVATVALPVGSAACTPRWHDHAVVHDLVPIFARDNTHEKDDRIGHVLEIGMAGRETLVHSVEKMPSILPSEFRSEFDATEKNDTGKGVDEHQQEHAENDEERFKERDDDRQH